MPSVYHFVTRRPKYYFMVPLRHSLLTLYMPGNISCFCPLLTFFKINVFKTVFQEHYQRQTVWIEIRTDILSVLILVQTVCKGYQQTTKATTSKEQQHSFRNTIRVSNSLDPDQDRHSVGPDLGPNCLQMLPTDNETKVAAHKEKN